MQSIKIHRSCLLTIAQKYSPICATIFGRFVCVFVDGCRRLSCCRHISFMHNIIWKRTTYWHLHDADDRNDQKLPIRNEIINSRKKKEFRKENLYERIVLPFWCLSSTTTLFDGSLWSVVLSNELCRIKCQMESIGVFTIREPVSHFCCGSRSMDSKLISSHVTDHRIYMNKAMNIDCVSGFEWMKYVTNSKNYSPLPGWWPCVLTGTIPLFYQQI